MISDISTFVALPNRTLKGAALAKGSIAFTVERQGRAPRLRRGRITNAADESVAVLRAGFSLRLSREHRRGDWRVFLDRGACGWCGVKRLDCLDEDASMQTIREQRLEDAGERRDGPTQVFHRSDLQTVLWDARSGQALLVGFLRQRHGPNKVDVVPSPTGRSVVEIRAWQELAREVDPGASLDLDPLVVLEGGDPYALLEQFGNLVRNHHGHRLSEVPVVGLMTWYGVRTAIDEAFVVENAEIVQGIFGGYPQKMQSLMLLDHGWQHDANWGTWERDGDRFPHTMAWLSQRLAKRGMKLGLWYTPFCVTENSPDHCSLASLQITDASGSPEAGIASVWGHLAGHPVRRAVGRLDAARSEVQRLWFRALRKMKGWGVIYWKLDFFHLRTGERESLRLGLGDLYARTWRGFRRAVGRRGHLAPCSAPTNLQIGYADSVRIAADIGNAGGWPTGVDSYSRGLTTIAALWYKHRRFWVNDADSVQLGKGCSLNEVRVRSTVAALSGGHLMLSEDLRGVSADRLEMFSRLLPPHARAARPLNLFETPYPDGIPDRWALRVDTALGPVTVLALFNLDGHSRTFRVDPSELGIRADRKLIALEWWSQRWLGSTLR